MTRRPPGSPLFPYTTLSRSRHDGPLNRVTPRRLWIRIKPPRPNHHHRIGALLNHLLHGTKLGRRIAKESSNVRNRSTRFSPPGVPALSPRVRGDKSAI